jgi:cellulose 1,4-beta-cellobiosidase
VNQWWQSNVQKEIDAGFSAGEKIINYNTGVWMDRIGAIEEFDGDEIPDFQHDDYRNIESQGPNDGFGLREHLEAAEDQGNALFHFVVYDLPGRDCSALASNGELPPNEIGMQIYQEHYIDRIARIIKEFPHIPIAAIIEIDSLPNLVTNSQTPDCMLVDNTNSWGYTNGVRYAVNTLSQMDNVHIYIDAGHSGWLGWDDDLKLASMFMHGVITGFEGMQAEAQAIGDDIEGGDGGTGKYTTIGDSFVEPPRAGNTTPPGYDKIDGFITNTANYTPLEEPYLGDAGSGEGDLLTATFYDWNPRFGERIHQRLVGGTERPRL